MTPAEARAVAALRPRTSVMTLNERQFILALAGAGPDPGSGAGAGEDLKPHEEAYLRRIAVKYGVAVEAEATALLSRVGEDSGARSLASDAEVGEGRGVEEGPSTAAASPSPTQANAGSAGEAFVSSPTRERRGAGGEGGAADWAARITACWRASVEAILEAGRLLIAAKAALPHGAFGAMIESELPFGPRTAERLMAIAADVRLANPTHVSHLPASWGTLYELTKLPDDDFERKLADGTIRPDMMRRDIAPLQPTPAEIARLAPEEQQAVLAEVARAPDTRKAFAGVVKELRAEKQAEKKERRETREAALGAKQRALPDRRYGVILADPEWKDENWSDETGSDRAASNHYPTSSVEVIAARPVGTIAAKDCALFLWAPIHFVRIAITVLEAWGFDYKTQLAWGKDRISTGRWVRSKHEVLILATRGAPPCPAEGDQWESLQIAPPGRSPGQAPRAHSEKPDWQYELIEAYFPSLPKIELNARRARPGWDAWGYEAPDQGEGETGASSPVGEDGEAPSLATDAEPGEGRDFADGPHLDATSPSPTSASIASDRAAVSSPNRERSPGGDGDAPRTGPRFVPATVDGVTAIVDMERGAIHAVKFNEPFPSETGFHSFLGFDRFDVDASDQDEACAAAIRHCIDYATNRKHNEAAKGLAYPDRVYRPTVDADGDLVGIDRGEPVELADLPPEVDRDELTALLDRWEEERYQSGPRKKGDLPRPRHGNELVVKLGAVFGAGKPPLVPVADYPTTGAYLIAESYRRGARSFRFVADGAALDEASP